MASIKVIDFSVSAKNGFEVILKIDKESAYAVRDEYDKFRGAIDSGKTLSVEMDVERKRRSLDANDYCWVLCQKIAEVARSTKVDVYRNAIRDVGPFELLPVRDDAVEKWIDVWSKRGIGWVSEVVGQSTLPGYTKVISYYGSSEYSSKEMSVLIDYLVDTAKSLGIETLSPDKVEALKHEWRS